MSQALPSDWRALFEKNFLTGPTVAHAPTITIREVRQELLKSPDEREPRRRWVIVSDEEKPWVPCQTTAACLGGMFGSDPNGWIGHRVTLYFDPTVRVGREVKGGIRVKGSPELKERMVVTIKLTGRKPFDVRLVPTGGPPDSLADAAQALGLTLEALDLAAESLNKPAFSGLSGKERAATAQALRAGSDKLAAIVEAATRFMAQADDTT